MAVWKWDRPGIACGQGSGFTLLELAVVLVVVGLLMGFSVTAWKSMQSSQRISAARSQLTTVSRCLEEYVLHSEKIPPQSYFNDRCRARDPWGENMYYQSSGDDQEVVHVGTKFLQDNNGTYPDAVWVLVSSGPDRIQQMVESPAGVWNCAGSDDLCVFTTRNDLVRQIAR